MQKYRLMADLYLAREELLAATAVANVTAKRALAGAANSTDRDVAVIAGQVRRLCEKAIELADFVPLRPQPARKLKSSLTATRTSNCKKKLEARVGIEPTHKGFADLSLTTWVPRPMS